MNDNEMESILKDALLIKLGNCLSSFLEETDENKKTEHPVYQSQSPEYNCTELKQNTVFRVTL
jgi:hypothetical protein